MMVGTGTPVVPAHHAPWTAITGAQLRLGPGFSKQQHLPPWQVEQDHGSHLGHPWLCHVGKGPRGCLGCSVLVSLRFAFEGMWISLPNPGF